MILQVKQEIIESWKPGNYGGKYHLRILTYTILEMLSYLFGAYYSYITYYGYIPFYPHVKML